MQAFDDFLQYKSRVPVRGAIMLNDAMDSVVLVKGWKKGANWSFPRGKINKDEADLDCAIREVYEETGFDIREAGLVPKDEDVKYIDITMREQQMRLYVFRGIPMHTNFKPRTRKEISKIQWYLLSELPAFRKKGQHDPESVVNANKFYMVAPFLVPLKKWVVQQKKKDAQRTMDNQHLVATFPEDTLTEEDQGTDRGETYERVAAQDPKYIPGIDTLEGATAALHRLLKIQPPTQGLQHEATGAAEPPVKSSGEALLALLQGKSTNDSQFPSQAAPPQTPSEHTITSVPAPQTPHRHSRPPVLPNMQPALSFPLELDRNKMPGPSHNQQPQAAQNSGIYSIFQKPPMTNHPFPQPLTDVHPHHNYQTQPLQHPQPLPPHVQPTLFNGESHCPVGTSPTSQQPAAPLSDPVPLTVSQSQLKDAHGQAAQSSMPMLTSHSLALLNAFKHRDITSSTDARADPPLRKFTQEINTSPAPLQELSADRGQHGRPNLPEMPSTNTKHPLPPIPEAPASLIEEHRSSLLNMFKSVSNKTNIVNPVAVVTTPTDILGGNEASSSLQASGDPAFTGSLTVTKLESGTKVESQSDVSGPNSPFRPLSIVSHTPQSLTKEFVSQEQIMGHRNGLASSSMISTSNLSTVAKSKRLSPGTNLSTNTSQSFQPKILKRPQESRSLMPAELAAPEILVQPSLEIRKTQDADHKQALLSLFGKGTASALPPKFGQPIASQPTEIRDPPISASSAGDLRSEIPTSNSQTSISEVDRGFLLEYLAKNARF